MCVDVRKNEITYYDTGDVNNFPRRGRIDTQDRFWFGLYGGTLSDAFDRRKVGFISASGLWLCSMAFLVQSLSGWNSVGVLYVVVAVQSAFFAVGNPARQSIIPRIVPPELLPSANALGMMTWNIGFTLGPVLGGLLVAATGTVTQSAW